MNEKYWDTTFFDKFGHREKRPLSLVPDRDKGLIRKCVPCP